MYFLIEHVDNRKKIAIPALGDARAVFAVRFAMPAGFWCNLAYAGGVVLGVLAKSGWDGPNFWGEIRKVPIVKIARKQRC